MYLFVMLAFLLSVSEFLRTLLGVTNKVTYELSRDSVLTRYLFLRQIFDCVGLNYFLLLFD